MLNGLNRVVVVRLIDISGIECHHCFCLSFLFIMQFWSARTLIRETSGYSLLQNWFFIPEYCFMPNTIVFLFLVLYLFLLQMSPLEAIGSFENKWFGSNRTWSANLFNLINGILLILGLQGLDSIYTHVFICARLNMDALFQVHLNTIVVSMK